ncbi:MAG: type II methionyl aminopeptidase [Candidatus Thorarchaeota archaeon]
MALSPHPDFIRAGQIAARILRDVAKEVRPGAKVLRVCTLAERKIVEMGAKPAFPCNVSINNEAAHYTSPHGDIRVFPDAGLVKVDLGANVNGHLSDTATTVDLDGSYEKFIVAARKALDAAIEIVRPGTRLGEIGAAIEQAIKSEGLRPVHQLSGHQLKPNNLHAGNNVPNVRMRGTSQLKAGETYAIEPFATDGSGAIKADRRAYIFANNMSNKKKLDKLTMQVRNMARRQFGTVPWASRWLYDLKKGFDFEVALKNLLRAGAISSYPVLLEAKDGMVSQAEHSVFVSEDGAIVSTMLNDS